MLISAETIPNGTPVSLQLAFTINGVTRYTPYAESLAAGSYRLVFPQTVTIDGVTYTILGNNDFTITHPMWGTESYFKASYFSDLPPPPIRVRFNTSAGGLVDWGEGPQEYGSMLVDQGSNVEVRAIPSVGYKFVFWRKNGVKVSERNPAVFSVDVDETTIGAVFVAADSDWTKYLPWIILGGGALLLFAAMGRGRSTVVVVGGKKD